MGWVLLLQISQLGYNYSLAVCLHTHLINHEGKNN
jgi:hypothetical protein